MDGIKMEQEHDEKLKTKFALKKLVKQLSAIKGRHTELVTVYVPSGYSLHEILGQLRNEQSTAENIKSKPVRKNVVSALEKIMRHIQLFKQTPDHGLALFCGNISESEAKTDIELWSIEPPEPIKTKMYWCDQRFVLDPLQDMVAEREIYGIINLDKSEGNVAILVGKKITSIFHKESIVPGKTRAGGQCLSPDTYVLMADGNILEIENVNNPHIIKSVDFSTKKLTDKPVLEKWNTKKDVSFVITTKCPTTQIQSSKDHLFFRWGNTIEETPAEDLKVGDFLLIPEKVDIKGKIQSLNTSQLYNSYKLTPEGSQYIKQRREALKLLQRELANISDVTQTSISVLELGKRDIKIEFLKRLCRNLEIDLDTFIRQFCRPNTSIKLPEYLDEKLAAFLGYFAGDGSFENERLSLHDASEQIIKCYCNLGRDIFNCETSTVFRKNKGHYLLRIYGKPIVKLIKSEFSELKYASDTKIPQKILQSPNSVLAAFLRGFFDAEGYVNKDRGIGLGINNKKLARQIQLALLRFGILASVVEYDNRRNPYSKKHRFTIGISDRSSLELFFKEICFYAEYKQEKLKSVINCKSKVSYTRQIFATGENIRKIIENEGYKITDFPKVTNFFRNERLMSKGVFRDSILSQLKGDERLYKKLKKVLDYDLIPVKIKSIKKIAEKTDFIDIEVKNSNFIANGLVVHNSSARFGRIREGLLNDWLKEVGEAANKIFTEHKDVIGILLSGPGPIKDMFLKEDYMQADIKKKILGLVDTSYTGDHGLEETLERGEDLIKELGVTKEKNLLQKFFNELQKPHGLVTYGFSDVLKAMEVGAVDLIILSEACDLRIREYTTPEGETKVLAWRQGTQIPQEYKLLADTDVIEYFEEKARHYGSRVEVVSPDTREGLQFAHFGGIGALLRYTVY